MGAQGGWTHDLHAMLLLHASAQLAPIRALVSARRSAACQGKAIPTDGHSRPALCFRARVGGGCGRGAWTRLSLVLVATVMCCANNQHERCLEVIVQHVIKLLVNRWWQHALDQVCDARVHSPACRWWTPWRRCCHARLWGRQRVLTRKRT